MDKQTRKQKAIGKYSPKTRALWYEKVVKFAKEKTDVEIIEVNDLRRTNGFLSYHCKIKDGQILISKPFFYWLDAYYLLHEIGHLATIPKKYRKLFTTDLNPKSIRKVTKIYNETKEPFTIYGNELVTQFWTRCVAVEIGLPLWPFNFLYTNPYKTQNDFLNMFGHLGFWQAKELGISKEKFILEKYNS